MPMIDTAFVASPRRAKPGPVTTGVTATTSGIRSTAARTFCHWSSERSCCERGWTCAATAAGSSVAQRPRDLIGRRIWIGAWKLSVRRMMFACRPASSADMKMITPPPSATPKTMSSVCVRPSRMKRNATTVSKNANGFTAGCFASGDAHALAGRDRRAGRGIRRSPGATPSSDLDLAFALADRASPASRAAR